MAASELLAISRKLKPLLSKGILIAFSGPTGGKGKLEGGRELGGKRKGRGGRDRVSCQKKKQRLPTSPTRLVNGFIVRRLLVGGNSMPINVKGYACFNIGFVSVVPVNTRGYWSWAAMDDGDKEHQGKTERMKAKDMFMKVEGDIWAVTGNRWSPYERCCRGAFCSIPLRKD